MSAETDALRERSRLINNTDAEVRALLRQAADEIAVILAQQPSDYQRWYLPKLLSQIEDALKRWGDEAADAAGNGQRAAWRGGSALVDDVIGEAVDGGALSVNVALPVIDDAQLSAMTSFLTSKVKGATVATVDAINTQLGMVVIGAKTPFEAVQDVQAIMDTTARRAGTIVRTELARAYSTANQARMMQWGDAVPGLQKKWRKSGKLHPRERHVLIDGQVRDVDQPYNLPGDIELMYPHDPEAPASETINCGCCSVPVVPGWQSKVKRKTPDNSIGGDAVPLADALGT